MKTAGYYVFLPRGILTGRIIEKLSGMEDMVQIKDNCRFLKVRRRKNWIDMTSLQAHLDMVCEKNGAYGLDFGRLKAK